MATDVDGRLVATFASIPESTVNILQTNPTVELVTSLLLGIEKKIKEFEHFKSQNTKLEVELETVTRTNESKVKVLQNSRDKALADAGKLREDLQQAESLKAQAQAETERLQQHLEAEVSEATSLRNRLTSLEASHRDTLTLLDSKSKEIERLAQDLATEHDKVVAFRRQVSELEQSKQEASSALTGARYKITGLEQEIELLRKNADWFESERKAKGEEHQKFRKEKNARVAELQQTLELRIDEVDSLKRLENSLRGQLEDLTESQESLHNQIQSLNEDKLRESDHHRQELDNLNRLVALQKAAADTAKTRVDELTRSIDETRSDAAEEIGRIRAEAQEDHNERQAAEQRVQELENMVKTLESTTDQRASRPGTPTFELNGQLPATPIRLGTPLRSHTPGSVHRLKSGLTTTQLFSEYTKLEKELANERQASHELQQVVDEMLADLEAKKPEIDELRSDNERLQQEIADISNTVNEANEESAAAKKQLGNLQKQLEHKDKEFDEATQMARDLGSQIRRLMLEQQAGSLSDVEYDRLLKDLEVFNTQNMAHLSEPQQQVNQYLLAFKNIAELQEVNQKQVATIRNLLAQVESAEALEAQHKIQELERELESANTKMARYQDSIKDMVAQTNSFVKERDMFRSMLTRRGQIDPNDFSRSMPLPAGGFSTSVGGDHTPARGDGSDLAKVLRDLQNQYDTFRREAGIDTTTMKTQIADLTQRNSHLQAEASKNFGQLSAATQRYEMMSANFATLKNDNVALQQRYSAAVESATRIELKAQQAAEELVEARGSADGLRRETANLKAEKDLWKSIEQRLLDDNASLRNDRARLDTLNVNLQTLLNEKEHADAEARRRMQTQTENLEAELQSIRRKLNDAIEDRNQALLRRNYEQEQNQKKVDELVSNLSTAREELVAAKTARDHLQARNDEFAIELRSAEERLEVLSRPAESAPQQNGSNLTDEQQLAVEVSELKRDLDLKTTELAKAEEVTEEYKGIAQAAEERLQQFMDTNEEDKADLQTTLDDRETTIKNLQQRVDDITTELTNTNTELNTLRDQQSEADRRLESEKAKLQAEIDRLRLAEEKASEQAALYLEASREQQKIAEERQENYETELVKHTEAVKVVQTVRAEANDMRLKLAEAKAHVENAQQDLQQKETSWLESESKYKQEIESLKVRRDELQKHNKSLHESLETLNAQLATLQRSRATATEENAGHESQGYDLSSLNEVIRYLREEKEIIEIRHHGATLELERVKRLLDSTQSQLDSTRLKLDQAQRTAINNDMTAMSNNKLAETVTELNLYRESSTTLRIEKNQALEALKEKTARVEELEQELLPLQARVAELEHHLELSKGELDLAQKDRDHWQERTKTILSKYDRVDPQEIEDLKSSIKELEAERNEAVQKRDELQIQVDNIPEAVSTARAQLKATLQEQFKTRDAKMKAERLALQDELTQVKAQLENVKEAPESTVEQEAAAEESVARIQALETQVQELQQSLNEKDAQMASNSESRKAQEDKLKDMLNKRLAEVKKEAEAAKQSALEALRSSLETEHQQALEELRAKTLETVSSPKETSEDQEVAASDEQPSKMTFDEFMRDITSDQVKLLLAGNANVKSLITNSVKAKVLKEKESWLEQIKSEQPEASNEDAKAQIAAVEEAFTREKTEIIRQKDEELSAERENIIQEQQQAFELEKQSILNDQDKKIADEVANAKASTEKLLNGKLNLISKSNAINLAKVNVVKQAAADTPDKPVKEVWDIASKAKPPQADQAKAAASAPKPGTSSQIPAAAQLPATAKANTQPAETNGKLSPAPENTEATGDEKAEEADSENTQTASSAPTAPTGPSQARPASQLPRGHFSGRGGRGRGASSASGSSNLPRPGSAVGNHAGSSNTRGRGRGGQAPNSPSRGGLNPTATGFTPQNKRPREDNDEGGAGKKIRGTGTS